MSKERFKVFASNHPELVDHVLNGEVSWQSLYEIFDIYGENNKIWNKYITNTSNDIGDLNLKDIFSKINTIDMDSFQKGIENLQKTIGLLQGLSLGNTTDNPYIPRESYQHMED